MSSLSTVLTKRSYARLADPPARQGVNPSGNSIAKRECRPRPADKTAPMTREDYDAFCGSLPHATHVVQWGDASVWKIGGKVFAIGGWFDGPEFP